MRGKIAYLFFGGSGTEYESPMHRGTIGRLTDVARWAGPILERNGYTRVLVHNHSGVFPLLFWDEDLGLEDVVPDETITARVNLARTDADSVAPWASKPELRRFHNLLRDKGMTEIIYQLGPFYKVKSATRKTNVRLFSGLEGASFSFQKVAEVIHWTNMRALFIWIRDQFPGARIYVDRRPRLGTDEAHRVLVDGTIETAHRDGKLPERQRRARKYWGEFIVRLRKYVEGRKVTQLVDNWKKG